MAGRPHAGQLRPGVPTAQLHQPPRWFQVSDYPPLLYLARIEHSPAQRTAPDVNSLPQVPTTTPPLLPSCPFRVPFEGKGQAPAPAPAPALVLVDRLCPLPRQLVFRMLLFLFFRLLLIRRALPLPLRPRLAGIVHYAILGALESLPSPKWAAGLDQVKPDLSTARRPLGSEQLHTV